jgi:D-alanyl-D-alanine carboxypeptidase/D-alanyl-D-alanine-endopeptidase (penicillin-binding protein 4)
MRPRARDTRLAIALIAAVTLAAPPVALAREPAPEALRRAIDRIVGRPQFSAAFWGIEIRSLKTGKILYSRNAGKNLKPASTFKLLTTAAALDAMSPDERIRTTVETAGTLDPSGRLTGDVYLVGRGDANLSGRFVEGRYVDSAARPGERRIAAELEQLAEQLMAAGVSRIEGRLIGHEGLFKGDRRGQDWAWEDLVWSYGAEVSALSFNDNCADLKASAGARPGDALVVERNPISSYYQVVSTATTSPAGTKSDLTLVRDSGSNVIKLSGTHPLGDKPWQGSVALEDPARYAASVFAEVLEGAGIRLEGEIATSSEPLPEGLRVLAAHDSPPLAEIVKAINKPSQNLHTELLLRLLAARVKGEGSVAAGHEALKDFLRRIGVSPEPGELQDASGLSRSDLLQPHEVVNLLVAMDTHPRAQAFRDSLPVAGVDGTLKNRMKGTPAERRIVAKTGSMRHVSAMAGYATHRAGERFAFSIVLNHFAGESRDAVAAIDEIANLLVR